jgi:hypothetical protein
MVETQVVESKIEDAETLLRELDRENFPVEGMFWINRPETQAYRSGYRLENTGFSMRTQWTIVGVMPSSRQKSLAMSPSRI